LKKASAEADFSFIWGYLGCRSLRRSAHFAKDGRISHRTNLLEKTQKPVKTSLREFFLWIDSNSTNAVGADTLHSDESGASNNAFGDSDSLEQRKRDQQHCGGRSGAYEQHWR
jgi:hypothetical protein